MDAIVKNKCYSCGKTFRDESDFNRHKNRKTPCLIRDIKPEDIKHPNRCIYCNKILSKQAHLERHHKTCKIKNGGMNMLFDKVKYEEAIRIMQEERDRDKEERDRDKEESDKLLAEMRKEMDEMKKKMEELQKTNANVTNVNNGTVVNGNVNNVNIVINNFATPNISHLLDFSTFSKMLGTIDIDLPVEIVLNVYFDPSYPENASVHVIDKETKHVLAMVDGKWNTFTMEKIVELLREIGYKYAFEGFRLHGTNKEYPDRVRYIAGKISVIKAIEQQKIDAKTIKYECDKIEKKLLDEFVASSKHPHVIAHQQKRKKEIAAAKTQTLADNIKNSSESL